MLEPLDPPDPHEAAFTAAPFAWKNIPLHALAIAREGDWLMHCRRIGLPALHECIGSAETFLPHAVRLLWFCAHEPVTWLSAWMKGGEAAPVVIENFVRAWSEEQITPGDQPAVLKLALDIYDRAHANEARLLDPGGEDTEGNASGPRTRLNTSASSRGPAPDSSVSSTSATHFPRSAAGPTSTRTAARKVAATNGPPPSAAKRPRSRSASE